MTGFHACPHLTVRSHKSRLVHGLPDVPSWGTVGALWRADPHPARRPGEGSSAGRQRLLLGAAPPRGRLVAHPQRRAAAPGETICD